jgi:LacI family transcriptional regulator
MAARLEGKMLKDRHSRRVVLSSRRASNAPFSDLNVADDALVAAALRFIRDHAKQVLSVNQIAEELRVSRRAIERRFPYTVGRTILAEIILCHLRRAEQLLAETDLLCHAIAVASGIGSLKSFSRSLHPWNPYPMPARTPRI